MLGFNLMQAVVITATTPTTTHKNTRIKSYQLIQKPTTSPELHITHNFFLHQNKNRIKRERHKYEVRPKSVTRVWWVGWFGQFYLYLVTIVVMVLFLLLSLLLLRCCLLLYVNKRRCVCPKCPSRENRLT